VSLRQRINRLKRQVTPDEQRPPVVAIINNPEATRLGFDLTEREALIASEVVRALDGETLKAFHDRICGIARERNVMLISVGSDAPVAVARYNLDGSPVTVN
jgi:hypothetical protein